MANKKLETNLYMASLTAIKVKVLKEIVKYLMLSGEYLNFNAFKIILYNFHP